MDVLAVRRQGMMPPDEAIRACKRMLQAHYGPRFRGLVLYGSMARGQTDEASDIDLLVLLEEPFDLFEELRRIVELLYPIQLESERLISAKPASVEAYEAGSVSLYRNARREGVAV
jgi:predicted nucleotidyltransferase